jgi:conserved oligomeric Golgi complex subunit 6
MIAYSAGADSLTRGSLDVSVSPGDIGSGSGRGTALSTKLATVLSTPYADSELREALRLFELRDVASDDWSRQNLKALADKEVIDSNARVVDDFGQVAEVRAKNRKPFQ